MMFALRFAPASLRGAGVAANETAQRFATLDERAVAEIFAIEVDEIEREKDEPVALTFERRPQSMEVRPAGVVLDNHLAVDKRGPAGSFSAAATSRR